MGNTFELSELEDVAELMEMVEEGTGKAVVTIGQTERFVVMTAERYRALSDGYAREKERATSLQAQLDDMAQHLEQIQRAAAHPADDEDVSASDAKTSPAGRDNSTVHREPGEHAMESKLSAFSTNRMQPYRSAQLPMTPIDSDDYQRSMWQDAIVERMQKVIEAEAPIEKQRLFNMVRGSFGVKRSGRDIQSHNEWLFNRRIDAPQSEFNGATFVWRADQDPAAYDSFRPADEDSNRQITEYPYEELQAAILDVLERDGRHSRDDLMEAVMRILGYKRKTSRMKDVLGVAIERAAEEGRIRVFTDGTFRIAEGA